MRRCQTGVCDHCYPVGYNDELVLQEMLEELLDFVTTELDPEPGYPWASYFAYPNHQAIAEVLEEEFNG